MATMVPNPVTISRRTPLFFRFAGFSLKPVSHSGHQIKIPTNPVQISGFKTCSSCNSQSFLSNYSPRVVFKDLGCSEIGNRLLGSDYFRVSAVSDGSSGGNGGYGISGGGNSGGKDEGSGGRTGDGGGQSIWSLISWCLTHLVKYPVSTKAVPSEFLTFIGDLICQVMIDQVPSIDIKRTFLFTFLGLVLVGHTLHFWLAVLFLPFDVLFMIFCVVMACVVFVALFCCFPVVATIAHAMTISEGASENDIRTLPNFMYHRVNSLRTFGNNRTQEPGELTVDLGSSNSTPQLAVQPEDSECCICLCQYVDGVELCALPCKHHFHYGCISKWLRIKATCPLCKFNILRGDESV